MAMAVRASQLGHRAGQVWYMLGTAALGLAFLVVKSIEYTHKYEHHLVPGAGFMYSGPDARNVELFFSIYFVMTAVHALHMIIGLGILARLIPRAWRGAYGPDYHHPIECFGLYWHFVDIVWIFLFPLLYLLGKNS